MRELQYEYKLQELGDQIEGKEEKRTKLEEDSAQRVSCLESCAGCNAPDRVGLISRGLKV